MADQLSMYRRRRPPTTGVEVGGGGRESKEVFGGGISHFPLFPPFPRGKGRDEVEEEAAGEDFFDAEEVAVALEDAERPNEKEKRVSL